MSVPVFIAANRGDIGGGEVMLLHLADALRAVGMDVVVVGPEHPSDLADQARKEKFPVEIIPATDRRSYLMNLRTWDRTRRDGILWCNGLVPAFATAGRPHRIVHLHQRPAGRQRLLAEVARRGALLTVVPSLSMAEVVAGSRVLSNFVPAPITSPRGHTQSDKPLRLGFLGRLSHAKGVDVLARALRLLERSSYGTFQLVLGGEARFVGEGEATRIQERIDALRTPVEWLGWADPGRFFSTIDVLVVPSIWQEPFGLVALEAMAAGVPVIVSDAGALPEVVGPDHPWIVPAGDAGALADVLKSVASTDPATLHRAVKEARSRWASRFSPEAGRRQVQELLSRLPQAGL